MYPYSCSSAPHRSWRDIIGTASMENTKIIVAKILVFFNHISHGYIPLALIKNSRRYVQFSQALATIFITSPSLKTTSENSAKICVCDAHFLHKFAVVAQAFDTRCHVLPYSFSISFKSRQMHESGRFLNERANMTYFSSFAS
jgi:hypothetical protein